MSGTDTIRFAGLKLTIEGAAEFERNLNEVNRGLKQSQAELNKVTNAYGKNERNIETLTARKRHLENATRLNREEQQRLNAMLEKAREQYGENSREVQTLQTRLTEAEAKGVGLTRQLSEITAALQEQERALRGQRWTEFGQQMEATGQKMQAVGNRMKDIGGALSLSVTAPLMAIAATSIKVAEDFGSSMGTIQARTNMTADEIDKLGDNFRAFALSGNYGIFSAREIASAFADISVAGQDVETSTEIMRASMVLASAVGDDLGSTAYFLGNYLAKVGKDASYAEKYINLFAEANQRTGIGLDTLQNYLFRANASLQLAGISGTEATAVFSELYRAGVRGANAYSGFSQAIQSIMLPSDDASYALKILGVNVDEIKANGGGMMDVLFAIGDALDEVECSTKRLALTQDMFSQSTAFAFADELFNQRDALRDIIPELYEASAAVDGTGRAFQMAAIQNEGLTGSIQQIRNSFEEIQLQIASHLIPHAQKLVDAIGRVVDRFTNLDESTQRTIIKFAAVAAAIGPVLVIAGKLVTSVGAITIAFGKLSTIIGAARGLKFALGGLKLAFAPIALKIAPVIAAGVLLYKNWDTIREKAQALWKFLEPTFNKIRKFFMQWGQQVAPIFSELFQDIKELARIVFEALSDFWERWGSTITTYFGALFENVKIIVSTAFEIIRITITTVLENINHAVNMFSSLLQGDWQGAWDALRNIVENSNQGITDAVKALTGGMLDMFANTVTAMFQIGADIVSGMIQGLDSRKQEVVDAATKIISGFTDRIKSFFGINSPSRLMSDMFKDVGQGMIVGTNSKVAELANAAKNLGLSFTETLDNSLESGMKYTTETLTKGYAKMCDELKKIARSTNLFPVDYWKAQAKEAIDSLKIDNSELIQNSSAALRSIQTTIPITQSSNNNKTNVLQSSTILTTPQSNDVRPTQNIYLNVNFEDINQVYKLTQLFDNYAHNNLVYGGVP